LKLLPKDARKGVARIEAREGSPNPERWHILVNDKTAENGLKEFVIADGMIVASGRSNRHVGAIADQLVEKLKGDGRKDLRIEGMPNADWVLVDAGDVIVHIFRPEVRSFYNLEKLWSDHAPDERVAV